MLIKSFLSASAGAPLTEDPILMVGGISRSGTTLLATVLDAHPRIAMGAELLPGPMSAPAEMRSVLQAGMAADDQSWETVGRYIRSGGDKTFGTFVTRCRRAGLTVDDVLATFDELETRYPDGIEALRERYDMAWRLMRRRWQRDGGDLFGFKLNTGSIGFAASVFPNARFACIIRDPADVVHSQIKRGFNKTPAEIATAWASYSKSYHDYAQQSPERCVLIRYEDLVSSPRRTIGKLFDTLPIDIDPVMFDFYRSTSAVLKGDHPNAEQLRTNFSADGIGKGWDALDADTIRTVHKYCGAEMDRNGYAAPGFKLKGGGPSRREDFPTLPILTVAKETRRLKSRRNYAEADYEALLAPYMDNHVNLRLCDYVRKGHEGDNLYLLIRHDVDHDIETARKIGRWEEAHGLKSTYCILHTAWYYGEFKNGRYHHTRELMDGIFDLLSQGHEINFHNNLAVLALREGIDPFAVLEQELEFYHNAGVPIVGTSTHGDRLCRELEFRNWELFSEACDDRFGGVRTLEFIGDEGRKNAVPLGSRSMLEFGLEYEAYDIARDIYHTDSGGTLRTRRNVIGRRTFGRLNNAGEVVGVLTHPIWWKMNDH